MDETPFIPPPTPADPLAARIARADGRCRAMRMDYEAGVLQSCGALVGLAGELTDALESLSALPATAELQRRLRQQIVTRLARSVQALLRPALPQPRPRGPVSLDDAEAVQNPDAGTRTPN